MGPPAAHQVEDRGLLWKESLVNPDDFSNRLLVDMHHKARLLVEKLIIRLVESAAQLWRQKICHFGSSDLLSRYLVPGIVPGKDRR
jgi:hypothetical protein